MLRTMCERDSGKKSIIFSFILRVPLLWAQAPLPEDCQLAKVFLFISRGQALEDRSFVETVGRGAPCLHSPTDFGGVWKLMMLSTS